jgi:ABC-type sugar transport system permease subunit
MAKGTEVDVYFYDGCWSHGGDVLDANQKAAFNSQAGVKALTLYKSMLDRGLTEPGPTNYTREDLQNQFKQGRLAMVMTAPFLINQIAEEAPTLEYGIVPVPVGTTSATYAVTDSVVLFGNSKVKPAAMKWLDFLFSAGPRIEFTKGEGFLPTTVEEAKDPAFTQNERLKVFVDLLPNARFAPTVTGWEDTAKAVTDAVQSVYLGTRDAAGGAGCRGRQGEPVAGYSGARRNTRLAADRPQPAAGLRGDRLSGSMKSRGSRCPRSRDSGQVRGFAGWENFARIASDPVFVDALVRTLVWTVSVVGGTILVSIPVSLVLREDFAGRGLARTIVMLPWSIALSMAAVVWLWAFNADYGMINATLLNWGLIAKPLQWMARPETAFPVEVGIGIIVSIPFTVTILLGGLSSIPEDIYEAARIDGASPWQSSRA